MSAELAHKYLPPVAREIASRIGASGLRLLVDWRGGTRIYVPSRPNLAEDSELVQVIGMTNAQALAGEKGEWLQVPKCAQAARALQYQEIRAYRRNHTERQTALHFSITENWVRQLMRTADPEPQPQVDMFT